MNKIAYITGATSGIGKACAMKFADYNYNLIINGRRKEILDELAETIRNKYKVEVLTQCFDIRDRTAVKKSVKDLPMEWRQIDVLINNAGLASGLNPIQEGLYDDWDKMIDTNVKGLLYMTRYLVPLMILHNKGHIVNIGSIAGRDAYPNGNVYCGTKAAVDSITRGIRMDLLQYGIRVSLVEPGAVETEFSEVRFKGDKNKAKSVYEGYEPLTGDDVADVVYFVCSLPVHVNISDVMVVPTAQANPFLVHKNL